jgi:hypothetical protein
MQITSVCYRELVSLRGCDSRATALLKSAMGSQGRTGFLSKQVADGIGKSLPERAVIQERTFAAPRHLVDAALAPRLGRSPVAREVAGILEAVQGRIDRTLGQIEGASAPSLDLLG